MPGKRVQFDDETWQAIEAVMRGSGRSFQELASEAFADLMIETDDDLLQTFCSDICGTVFVRVND